MYLLPESHSVLSVPQPAPERDSWVAVVARVCWKDGGTGWCGWGELTLFSLWSGSVTLM